MNNEEEETHARRVHARICLVQDADARRFDMSRDAWEERALDSDFGQLIGWREVDAIGALVFGKKKFRAR